MFKIKNNWSLKKHIIFSLIISFVVQIIKYISITRTSAASIGIIGGADGPTAIFLANKIISENISRGFISLMLFLDEFIIIPVFIILLALYKPAKYLVEK